MTPKSLLSEDTTPAQEFRPGSRPPFFYKSGPDWPDVAPKVRPAIVPQPLKNTWGSVCQRICERLDSCSVRWRSIDPLAFANEDEAKPFCPFIICVGVDPKSVQYEDAVRAAGAVKEVLIDAGCPEVEVGFMEVTYWGSMAAMQCINENRNHSGPDQEQG
ncbi:hypothetical protein D9619_009273 [Psilocybe cf. subviscida]|uniref:Uncharacterized protein n=1 Tax=Psilocybe cf. subviscida TaxID=2480587 RepID=A0A8H5FA54_9AGAR|nr:hypothetical protein D9619_009273 [Psilocybe cf. subviscida]